MIKILLLLPVLFLYVHRDNFTFTIDFSHLSILAANKTP